MKKRVLVLTDLSTHSDQNSIYALLAEMIRHESCASIHLASRGAKVNDGFFKEMRSDGLYALRVKNDFSFQKDGENIYSFSISIKPSDVDVLFLRLPRPISDEFLKWLDEIFAHAVIINKPSGIIKTSNKKFLLSFPEVMPPTKLCRTVNEVKEIANQFTIVLKPLREYGGKGILRVDKQVVNDGKKNHLRDEYLKTIEKTLEDDGYLAMKYLSNVSKGDKRILVVGDQILAASLRLPAQGSWLCNVAKGGTSVKSDVTEEEETIVATIAPTLQEKGILIYGVDTLVDDDGKRILSEVNTLSIGGFPQAEAQTQRPIIKQVIHSFFKYIDDRSE